MFKVAKCSKTIGLTAFNHPSSRPSSPQHLLICLYLFTCAILIRQKVGYFLPLFMSYSFVQMKTIRGTISAFF